MEKIYILLLFLSEPRYSKDSSSVAIRKTVHSMPLLRINFSSSSNFSFFETIGRNVWKPSTYEISLFLLRQLCFCCIFNVFFTNILQLTTQYDDASKNSLIVIHFSPLSFFLSFTCILTFCCIFTSLLYFTLLPTLSSFNTYNGAYCRQ